MTNDDMTPEDIKSGYRRAIRRVDIPISNLLDSQKCEIKEIEKGTITSYKSPPGSPVATETDALLAELRVIAKLLGEHKLLFDDIRSYLSYKIPPESSNLLEIQQTTSVATPGARNSISADTVFPATIIDPITLLPVIIGYNEIEVWNLLSGRKAPRVWMVNDGVQGTGAGDNLYVRISPDGKNFSPEFLMILGEIRIASDVYAIRFRSPTADITLRATEREIYPPYVTTIANTFTTAGAVNRPNFIAQNVALNPIVPAPNPNTPTTLLGQQLPAIAIPDGYAISIRANINNTGNVFISRTDATIAANSVTLGTGDSITLFITNASIVRAAGSIAGQSVDLLVEQN